jgi:hypothetical protein
MRNKGSKEWWPEKNSQGKMPSGSPLGKMIKYWDDSPYTKGEGNNEWLNTAVLFGPKN